MRLIDADALPKYTGYALSADEVAKAVENAPTIPAPRWHRVEEPPKKEKRYLVWDVDGFAYCDTWKEGEWQVASSVPGTNISHWMPIEPPQEVQE